MHLLLLQLECLARFGKLPPRFKVTSFGMGLDSLRLGQQPPWMLFISFLRRRLVIWIVPGSSRPMPRLSVTSYWPELPVFTLRFQRASGGFTSSGSFPFVCYCNRFFLSFCREVTRMEADRESGSSCALLSKACLALRRRSAFGPLLRDLTRLMRLLGS